MISLAFAMCISYKVRMKAKKLLFLAATLALLIAVCGSTAFAAEGDVAGAIEETWDAASDQIKTVVDNVVFPALDMILAIAFFVKLGSAYFDYRKGHQFEWAGPAILLACLIFCLTAPKYIWGIVGM